MKDSIAPQKTDGSLSSGFHQSDWNICSCVSDIGISSLSRIMSAVMKWWPVPSAPAPQIDRGGWMGRPRIRHADQ